MNDIEKEALPIQALFWLICYHCQTIAVAVLEQENVKLNICDDYWLENSFSPYFGGDITL